MEKEKRAPITGAFQAYFRRFDVTKNVTKQVKISVNRCKTGTRNPNILCVNSSFTTKYWGFQILAEKERFRTFFMYLNILCINSKISINI